MAEHETQEEVDDRKSADAVTLHRTVREEGEAELERPATALIWSGFAAGIAIATSLVAEGAIHARLPDAPWRELIVAFGYPIGFLIVILGRMQLFTESTITAMLPLATAPSGRSLWRTLRLWALVLGANLVGTAAAAAAQSAGMFGDGELNHAMLMVSRAITEHAPLATFANAIPAGFLIAIIAWTLPNAREQSFWVITAVTYVVAIGGFSHSVVGSVEAFVLLFAGETTVGQTAFGLIGPAVLGNLVGGAGLFALLAHAQARADIEGEA